MDEEIKKELDIAKIEYDKILNSPSLVAFKKIDGFMDFLSTTTTSSIKLKLESNKEKFSINIEPTNPNNADNENIKYGINEKNTIITNLDNGKIETIGCILDPRTDKDKSGDINGQRLGELITAHNFVGFLYDLYIYDRTKME